MNYFILKRAQLLSFRHFSMSKKKINIIRIYCTIPKTDYPQPKSCNFVCVSSCHEDKDAMHCKRMSCNCLLLQIPPKDFDGMYIYVMFIWIHQNLDSPFFLIKINKKWRSLIQPSRLLSSIEVMNFKSIQIAYMTWHFKKVILSVVVVVYVEASLRNWLVYKLTSSPVSLQTNQLA